VSRQCEMLPYRPEARAKFLCAFRVAKAAHATPAFARRLVAVFRPVVQPGSRFYEHVLYAHQLRNFGLCGRIPRLTFESGHVTSMFCENLRLDFRSPIARDVYSFCLTQLINTRWY